MSKRILIVDDEPDLLRVTAFMLKSLGYEILTANNGQEAIKMIQDQRVDLVLLDFFLPDISGFDICRQVKEDETLSHPPVILFTAGDASMIAKQVVLCGADGYITKPFDPDQLLSMVARATEHEVGI